MGTGNDRKRFLVEFLVDELAAGKRRTLVEAVPVTSIKLYI
jgi:hypothetical protein